MRLLVLSASLALAACSTPCEELAKEICSCEVGRSAQSACERRANQVESTDGLDENAQKACDVWLKTCDCNSLDTAEGKRDCGLADDPD